MPLPVIAGIVRCSIEATMSGEQVVNVLHLDLGSDPTPSADAASDLGAAWKSALQATGHCSNAYSANAITCQPLDGSSAGQTFVPSGWPWVGGSSVDPAPTILARILTLRTGLAGRSHRGRIYVGGLVRDDVNPDGTQWDPSVHSDWVTISNDLLTALSPGPAGAQLVVASYKLATASQVFAIDPRDYFGTQRRRND
jgi:hypothetical protein